MFLEATYNITKQAKDVVFNDATADPDFIMNISVFYKCALSAK